MYITMFFVLRFFREKYLKIKHFGFTSLFIFLLALLFFKLYVKNQVSALSNLLRLYVEREEPGKCTYTMKNAA